MTNLEEQLQAALARRSAPEGFTDRVLAGIGNRSRPRQSHRWLAAAAVVIAMLAGAVEHQRREREAQAAGRELVRAIGVVSSELESARLQVIAMGDSK